MLRLLVVLLLLANGTYYVWSQGLLRTFDFAPAQQSEPQRVAQQLRPEAMRVLKSDEAKRLESAPLAPPPVAARPPECLQAGLFNDEQTATLRRTLESTLPVGAWLLDPVKAEALAKKRGELASLNLKFEPVTNPALEYGLSLGGFETQAAATTALTALSKRGVRTAHVVQERVEVRGTLLKIPVADDAIKARFDELKTALAGKPLRTCK